MPRSLVLKKGPDNPIPWQPDFGPFWFRMSPVVPTRRSWFLEGLRWGKPVVYGKQEYPWRVLPGPWQKGRAVA